MSKDSTNQKTSTCETKKVSRTKKVSHKEKVPQEKSSTELSSYSITMADNSGYTCSVTDDGWKTVNNITIPQYAYATDVPVEALPEPPEGRSMSDVVKSTIFSTGRLTGPLESVIRECMATSDTALAVARVAESSAEGMKTQAAEVFKMASLVDEARGKIAELISSTEETIDDAIKDMNEENAKIFDQVDDLAARLDELEGRIDMLERSIAELSKHHTH